MDRSLSKWLALREPADFAARSAKLPHALGLRLDSTDPVRIIDLGTGTGSNLRYLIDHLPRNQEWLLVDRDARLLAEVMDRMSSWAAARGHDVALGHGELTLRRQGRECRLETRQMDLGALGDGAIFSGRHLVTASALLDLVSDEWLCSLAHHCRANESAALFALTYDGDSRCMPREPADDQVRVLMNRHQKTDKGFAPAAGPDATDAAVRAFEAAGYEIRREQTDWVLGVEFPELQRQLVEGWAHAALEMAPERAAVIDYWLTRRLDHIRAGRSRIVVGHEDLAAWPADAIK